MENDNNSNRIRIKGVMLKQEVANEYGVHITTLNKWLKQYGFYNSFPEAIRSRYFTPKQLESIYSHLGEP